MKKITAFFAVLIICLSLFSSVGQAFAVKNADPLTIIDFICLEKHIAANADYNADFDYNEDKTVDAQDLIALKRILLGVPDTSVEPDDDKVDTEVDDDGYYNDVVKP